MKAKIILFFKRFLAVRFNCPYCQVFLAEFWIWATSKEVPFCVCEQALKAEKERGGKTTPPAPQHPKRRLAYFQRHPEDPRAKHEIKKLKERLS